MKRTKKTEKIKATAVTKSSAIDSEAELTPTTEPISARERCVHTILLITALLVIGAIVFFGIRFALFTKNVTELKSSLMNTINAKNTEFSVQAQVESDKSQTMQSITAKGSCGYNSKDKSMTMLCELDFGNRVEAITFDTLKNDAYVYIESDANTDYLHIDISAIRYLIGKTDAEVDWNSIISELSDDKDVNMLDYYDMSKIDEVIENVKAELNNPVTLSHLVKYSYKNNTHTLTLNCYKLMTTFAKCIRPIFKSDKSYDNLLATINDAKETLDKQTITVTITEDGDLIRNIKLASEYDGSLSYADITLFSTGNTAVYSENDINPSIYETVSIQVAFNRIKRLGLDTDTAYSTAKKALNAFAESFSYETADGTVLILYDEMGNAFGYVYENYGLSEIEYGDKLYSAWSSSDYISLNATEIDVAPYSIAMYEPKKVASDSEYTDSYNYAYLAALQASQAISGAGYAITENAIFVVTEDEDEFQFIYQDGGLYDVVKQYYYYVYTGYGEADVSRAINVPENVTLYIPNSSDK